MGGESAGVVLQVCAGDGKGKGLKIKIKDKG